MREPKKHPKGDRFGQISTSYGPVGLVLGVTLAYLVLAYFFRPNGPCKEMLLERQWRVGGRAHTVDSDRPQISNPEPAAYSVILGKVRKRRAVVLV